MAGLAPPTISSVSSKKKTPAKKSASATKKRTSAARGRTAAIQHTAICAGEILGVGAASSALSAYRQAKGKSLLIADTVDARVVGGLLGVVAGLWKPSAKWSQHAINAGLGALGSWGHEYSFEVSGTYFGAAKPATTAAEGIVLGQLEGAYDDDEEAGAFGRKRRLKRIERRLGRLRARRTRIQSRLGVTPAVAQRSLPDYGGYERGGSPAGEYVRVPAWAVKPQYRARAGF